MGTVQIYDPAGGSEMNLFSAAGWKGMDAGTPIAGRDGWYRFSEYIQVTSETQEVVRIWAYVNTIAENYLYIDNLSVKYMEPLSDSASYTLQENDPSGWTTTGTGTVAKTDGDFAAHDRIGRGSDYDQIGELRRRIVAARARLFGRGRRFAVCGRRRRAL